MVDGFWIVKSGLKVGDVVIVSNLQKVRPGVPVQPLSAQTARKTAVRKKSAPVSQER